MSQINSSYPFAAAKVKAKETKLITQDKIGRVIEAKDFSSAMNALQETGYGQPAAAGASFEQLIQNEMLNADELLEEISPNDVFTKLMLCARDYHNLKVLIKLLMLDRELTSVELFPGNINVEKLRRALSENNYFDLPVSMKEALEYINKQFISAADVSIIGVALDRAYAKEASALVEEMGDPLVREYFTAYFDISNIIAFLRTRMSGHSKESFENAYLRGGSIDKRTFSEAFEASDDSVFGAVVRGDYARILAPAIEEYQKTRSLYMMEKARDDYLIKMLKESRHDIFGIGPLMGYYIAKQRESAAVRMVMTAKQGGINSEVVSKRLKELF